MLLFIFSLSGWSQVFNIATSSKTFRDNTRSNRSVNARIYYPVNPTPNQPKVQFPVVVLGHGFVMGVDAYKNFYDNLVPKGYIVAFVNTEGSLFANHDAYAKDLAFIVRAIQAGNTIANSVLNGIVANKSALLGHSMGGGAATLAASLVQVETLVTFAPAILRVNTLTPASNVRTESVVFSGSSDGVTPPAENHTPIYDNLGSTCKYFISITGGAHCYYANSSSTCDFGERSASNNIQVTRAQQQAMTFKFLNSWLDYKLKGNLNAKQQFTSDLASTQGITYRNGCSQNSVTPAAVQELKVQLLPNPASTTVALQIDGSESFEKAEIYNEYGQLLLTSNNDQLNVSDLRAGHYFVKVFSKNSVSTKRMII